MVGSFYEFERVFVWPVFDLVRNHNTGVTFSMFADAGEWKDYVLPGVAVAVSAGIVWYQFVHGFCCRPVASLSGVPVNQVLIGCLRAWRVQDYFEPEGTRIVRAKQSGLTDFL